MRTIPTDMAESLDGEATTFATAWHLVRRDGLTLGFTDHDRDIDVAGLLCKAATGLSASEAEASLGLANDQREVAGALSSDAITPEDIRAGLYDGATITIYRFDWRDPTRYVLLSRHDLGEVAIEDHAFRAELRAPVHALDTPRGRIFSHLCDAVLGDTACGVDLDRPEMSRAVTVTAIVSDTRIRVSGVAGMAAGLFEQGRARFADGRALDIMTEAAVTADIREIAFFEPVAARVEADATVTLVAGCDKRFSTCKARFANALNFRGFPHMPGSDFAYSVADGTGLHDGGPIHE